MEDISKLNYRKQAEIFLNKCYDRLNEEQRQKVHSSNKITIVTSTDKVFYSQGLGCVEVMRGVGFN